MSNVNPEYLRRNLIHATTVGTRANLSYAIKRLEQQSRPPKWLVGLLYKTLVNYSAVGVEQMAVEYRAQVPVTVEP
jgi:hypothetical protein